MPHPTGHRRSPAAIISRRAGFHLFRHERISAVRAAPLPASTNNVAKLPVGEGGPGIPDQGQDPTCEGQAHRGAGMLRLALAGTPVAPISAKMLYAGSFLVSRQPDPITGMLPGIGTDGTETDLVLQGWQAWGACSEADYLNAPYTNEPDLVQLEKGAVARMDGAYFVTSSGAQRLTDIATALAAGFPVSIALPASGPAFQGYSGGVMTAAQFTGDVDHENYIVDLLSWDGKDLNTAVWKLANSWGQWGEGGLYRVDSSAIQIFDGPAVINVSRVS
jgi:hypothetical protein